MISLKKAFGYSIKNETKAKLTTKLIENKMIRKTIFVRKLKILTIK